MREFETKQKLPTENPGCKVQIWGETGSCKCSSRISGESGLNVISGLGQPLLAEADMSPALPMIKEDIP